MCPTRSGATRSTRVPCACYANVAMVMRFRVTTSHTASRAEVHMYRSFDPNLPKPKPGREDQIDLVDPWYGGKHEFEVAIDQIEEVAPYIVDWVAKQL